MEGLGLSLDCSIQSQELLMLCFGRWMIIGMSITLLQILEMVVKRVILQTSPELVEFEVRIPRWELQPGLAICLMSSMGVVLCLKKALRVWMCMRTMSFMRIHLSVQVVIRSKDLCEAYPEFSPSTHIIKAHDDIV